ncbi:uncharacterized protein LOC115413135 [Sphaeramia orbicularis]|uniref:Uncharacterized LOC115413135 n=1 Tax=Sphaeramia orbicularis TaxID=375764 RepID=A0A673A2I0_9TELE|nr:uncharacterized protein LOC115413135 [Sphaeramia orbicularis]
MPGRNCCVQNCFSYSHDGHSKRRNPEVRYFGFPTWKRLEGDQVSEVTRRRRMAWVAAVRRKDITFENIPRWMRVCSLHFHEGKPSYEMLENHPDWAPSLRLGHNEVKETDKQRFQRHVKRRMRITQQLEQHQQPPSPGQHEEELQLQHPVDQPLSPAQQQEELLFQQPVEHPLSLVQECAFCASHREAINNLLEENRQLKEEPEGYQMNENFLSGDDNKVKYYTGLPNYVEFQTLLLSLTPYLPQEQLRKLSPFQLLLLTLMCLRLDLPIQHLCYLFQVHRTTASDAFHHTLSVMYSRLSPLVHWPTRESLLASMPHQFVESFGKNVAVIVDCFEVLIERPSDVLAGAQTFSQYKRAHTMKYLIVITPQGVISFISVGWGGRTSDKYITEYCGFLNKLLPGDAVLANRGFNIRERGGIMWAEVRGPAQLEVKDVEETRAIAHLRNYVKRVIGVVQNKFKFLHSTVPGNMLMTCEGENVTELDKVVTVCFALTNMCKSVV